MKKATTLAMMAMMMMMGSSAQEQEQGQGEAAQVDWKKPFSLSYTIMVSETSQVVGSMSDDAPTPPPNAQQFTSPSLNVSYDVTTIGGYTQDGNPEGMVTIDLSNFIQVQQDRQQERIEALKQAGIEIPPGADQLASVPESLSYVVKCEKDAFSKLVVQSPAGGCQDIALKGTGDRIIPAQSFVAKMICEQISPLAAFKSQCESWEPSGDGATEQGKDCTAPSLKDSIQNQAATIEASTLSVEQTATYQPDASNPDLFTTAEADTKSKVEISFKIPDLGNFTNFPSTDSNATADGEEEEEGDKNEGNRKLLQFQDVVDNVVDTARDVAGNVSESARDVANQVVDRARNVGDQINQAANNFVGNLQERFGGGAEVSGDGIVFTVENGLVDAVTISSLKQISDEEAQTAMGACA